MSVRQVAEDVAQPAEWVEEWWTSQPSSVHWPPEIPEYVAKYELRMLQAGIEPFRRAELRRGYANVPGLYDACLQQLPWRQSVIRRRNYQTGNLEVSTQASNRQDCVIAGIRTGVPRLDDVLDRVCRDFAIRDPNAHLVCNWYPDGKSSIGCHNHDHWSAIVSLGRSRIFLLDGTPVLLADGDLLVFGTQRHGLPKMPDIVEGRISVGVFWYPESRDGDEGASTCARCGLAECLLQEAPNGHSFCEACWSEWTQRTHERTHGGDDDLLTAAIQLSMLEQ